MKSIRKCLGENIKRLRQSRKLTQIAFAKRAGVSISFLQNIETGKRWVSPEKIEKIARSLGVPETDLFRDCDRAETVSDGKTDPRTLASLLCRALGLQVHDEDLRLSPATRSYADYVRMYSMIPDDVSEEMAALCRHPQWDWSLFRASLATLRAGCDGN